MIDQNDKFACLPEGYVTVRPAIVEDFATIDSKVRIVAGKSKKNLTDKETVSIPRYIIGEGFEFAIPVSSILGINIGKNSTSDWSVYVEDISEQSHAVCHVSTENGAKKAMGILIDWLVHPEEMTRTLEFQHICRTGENNEN